MGSGQSKKVATSTHVSSGGEKASNTATTMSTPTEKVGRGRSSSGSSASLSGESAPSAASSGRKKASTATATAPRVLSSSAMARYGKEPSYRDTQARGAGNTGYSAYSASTRHEVKKQVRAAKSKARSTLATTQGYSYGGSGSSYDFNYSASKSKSRYGGYSQYGGGGYGGYSSFGGCYSR